MDITIFDTYNIRARLSVYIIIIAPIILTLYFLYEPIRTFSFSAILFAIIIAFSNYLFALQRYLQKGKETYSNVAAELLYVNDSRISECTKQRYYKKLYSLDTNFSIFEKPSDSEEFKEACNSAITWLRNNTRNNKLVQEENMLYGFYKNLLSFKNIGLLFTLIAIFILFTTSIPLSLFFQSQQNIWLIILDAFFILFWILGVNKQICTVVAEKYAYALLGALDSLSSK